MPGVLEPGGWPSYGGHGASNTKACQVFRFRGQVLLHEPDYVRNVRRGVKLFVSAAKEPLVQTGQKLGDKLYPGDLRLGSVSIPAENRGVLDVHSRRRGRLGIVEIDSHVVRIFAPTPRSGPCRT